MRAISRWEINVCAASTCYSVIGCDGRSTLNIPLNREENSEARSASFAQWSGKYWRIIITGRKQRPCWRRAVRSAGVVMSGGWLQGVGAGGARRFSRSVVSDCGPLHHLQVLCFSLSNSLSGLRTAWSGRPEVVEATGRHVDEKYPLNQLQSAQLVW